MEPYKKPLIFISHAASEAQFASVLKKYIEEAFVLCEVFVSSEDIQAGIDWKNLIFEKLRSSILVIVVCSKNSILRPWISFETGVAWALNKKVMPILHSTLTLGDLPEPFNTFEAGIYTSYTQEIIKSIAQSLESKMPKVDYDNWNDELKECQIHKEQIPCEYISGQENIYMDAIDIIKRARKKIRVTGFGNVKKTPTAGYNKYKEALLNKLVESKNSGNGVELKVIYSSDLLPESTSNSYDENKIGHLVEMRHLNLPRVSNVLIVDNQYMHISTPVLKSDNGGLRNCIKITDSRIIEDYIDWYDEYLWTISEV